MSTYRRGIGLVGGIRSGKSTIGELLVKTYGFTRYEFRKPVEAETRAQGLDCQNRKNLQYIGNMMVRDNPRYWGDLMKSIITNDVSATPYVVEGIRNLGDIEALNELAGFTLVGVRAPYEVRCSRDFRIERQKNPLLDEAEHARIFREQDDRDNGRIAGGQQTLACIGKATHLINNSIDNSRQLELSLATLLSKLDFAVRKS